MPSFEVVRCCECAAFQVTQQKKRPVFACVLCGTKQKMLRTYKAGTAPECRAVVQQLNAARGAIEEQEFQAIAAEDERSAWSQPEDAQSRHESRAGAQAGRASRWSQYLPGGSAQLHADAHAHVSDGGCEAGGSFNSQRSPHGDGGGRFYSGGGGDSCGDGHSGIQGTRHHHHHHQRRTEREENEKIEDSRFVLAPPEPRSHVAQRRPDKKSRTAPRNEPRECSEEHAQEHAQKGAQDNAHGLVHERMHEHMHARVHERARVLAHEHAHAHARGTAMGRGKDIYDKKPCYEGSSFSPTRNEAPFGQAVSSAEARGDQQRYYPDQDQYYPYQDTGSAGYLGCTGYVPGLKYVPGRTNGEDAPLQVSASFVRTAQRRGPFALPAEFGMHNLASKHGPDEAVFRQPGVEGASSHLKRGSSAVELSGCNHSHKSTSASIQSRLGARTASSANLPSAKTSSKWAKYSHAPSDVPTHIAAEGAESEAKTEFDHTAVVTCLDDANASAVECEVYD